MKKGISITGIIVSSLMIILSLITMKHSAFMDNKTTMGIEHETYLGEWYMVNGSTLDLGVFMLLLSLTCLTCFIILLSSKPR